MKRGWCFLILVVSLAACTGNGNAVSVKTDSTGRGLDTLGTGITQKTKDVGDSVKSKFNDITESVKAGLDSIKQSRRSTDN